MPARGLPIFIDETPEYEARGDYMRVAWRGLEICLPMQVCQRSYLLCGEAINKWREARTEGAKIVRLPRH
jgi:hypothetical protein